jgi:hypothetical protein
MREQANQHSDPIPDAENWILVSDPFERPKIYRHKHAIFMAEDKCGVYIFVIRAANQAPIILHDIIDFEMSARIKAASAFSLYSAPVLRLIINDEPVEIGKAYPVVNDGEGAYLSVPDFFIRGASLSAPYASRLEYLRNIKPETPFRMKAEGKVNPECQYGNPRTFRGTLSAEATLAIKQAIVLYEHFKGTP